MKIRGNIKNLQKLLEVLSNVLCVYIVVLSTFLPTRSLHDIGSMKSQKNGF